MSAFRTDGTFTSASACGPFVLTYPFGDRDTTAVIYSQKFMVLRANYAAPTISSANGTFATAYCIGDTNFESLGQGIITYDRQWATIPASRNEWGTFAYQFVGIYGAMNPPYSQYWVADTSGGRDPKTEFVQSRLHHEYFLCAAGQTYTTPTDIPVLETPIYTLASNPNARVNYLLPAGVYWSDSVPTKEDYLTMVSNGDEIVAENSNIERWQGEIYVRITRYVTAQ